MRMRCVSVLVFLFVLALSDSASAQEPQRLVDVCDLVQRPKTFDGKRVRVRAQLDVDFEDFTLETGRCNSTQQVWMAFGGDVPGVVASTANDTVRTPGANIKVNGTSYAITKDDNFRKLVALISERHNNKAAYKATATLTGTFFSGQETKFPSGETGFMGYGHLGCCSLFVITQVSDVTSVPPAKLAVRGAVLGPNGKSVKGFMVLDDILNGSPPERQQIATDENGHFAFSISGQLLRFENPVYRPIALAVKPGGSAVTARLEDAKLSDWVLPPCDGTRASGEQVGFHTLFALPKTMESSSVDTIDGPAYFIFPVGSEPSYAKLIITNDRIASTAAFHDDGDLLAFSQTSEQRWIKDASGIVIGVDERGSMTGGKPWRSVIVFGHETALYDYVSVTESEQLDRILDSACVSNR